MADPAPNPAPPDDDLERWLEDEPPARPRGFTMRHPLLLLLVLAGSLFVAWRSGPGVIYLAQTGRAAACGDLADRPRLRAEAPAELPALDDGLFCQLSGTVAVIPIFATGEAREAGDPAAREAGRKYFLKLAGEHVFAVVAGDRPDVVDHRIKQGSLCGFLVEGEGRVIDPDTRPGYQHTARVLRLKFGIPDSQPIRLFDTTDLPLDHWPSGVALLLMALTAGLAAFGLLRAVRPGGPGRSAEGAPGGRPLA